MSSTPEYLHFVASKKRYFDPLCLALCLRPRPCEVGDRFAIASAESQNLAAFFEHDRGLCIFSLGAATSPRPMCSVEFIAERFPRIRQLSAGEQRLSLEEQGQFLVRYWSELQAMFSPNGFAETSAWIAAKGAEETARYSGNQKSDDR